MLSFNIEDNKYIIKKSYNILGINISTTLYKVSSEFIKVCNRGRKYFVFIIRVFSVVCSMKWLKEILVIWTT